MTDKEWHPNYPDWLKENRCTPCRMPSTDVRKPGQLSYTPVKCRDCMFAKISECIECGQEIRHCMRHPQNGPPSIEIDKPRHCVIYVKRRD